MSLTQLIYVSQRSEGLSDEMLEEIIAESAERNREKDVSGVLLMSGTHILQLLEGDSTVIEPLYERISADPRHTNVTCLLRKQVGQRLFPEWSMRIFKPREDANLDHGRMARMINDIRVHTNTRNLSVEARVLMNDFQLQLN